MSCKLALVFLVGLVALAVAIPVENIVKDVEVESAVSDLEKDEAPLDKTEETHSDQEEIDMDSHLPNKRRQGSGSRLPIRRRVSGLFRRYDRLKILSIFVVAHNRYAIRVKHCYRMCRSYGQLVKCFPSRRCHYFYLYHVVRIKG